MDTFFIVEVNNNGFILRVTWYVSNDVDNDMLYCSYLRSQDNSAVNPEHNTVYQVSWFYYAFSYLF